MRFDRRTLLLGASAALAVRPLRAHGAELLATERSNAATFVATARRGKCAFSVLLLAADGAVVREIPLVGRGHDAALHGESGNAVALARRPGTFAVAFNVGNSAAPKLFSAGHGRHFCGHGTFSTDGRLLFASENDAASGSGEIGVYSVAAGFEKIASFSSYGYDAHEIILLPDNKTLAIANGGLTDRQEGGVEHRDPVAMCPCVTFVNCETGQLRARYEMPADLNQLAIRHLATDANGAVWFGGQWEGALDAMPPVIGRVHESFGLRLAAPASGEMLDLKGYIGSIAASRDGRTIAATAPKAGRIVYIDAASGVIKSTSKLTDACGIANTDDDTFAVSSGFGVLRRECVGAGKGSQASLAGIAFDNHLRRLD